LGLASGACPGLRGPLAATPRGCAARERAVADRGLQLIGMAVAVLTSVTPAGGTATGHPGPTTRCSCRHPAGAANLIPPNSRQRQPAGTAASGPCASTTDSGDRVSVLSTRR